MRNGQSPVDRSTPGFGSFWQQWRARQFLSLVVGMVDEAAAVKGDFKQSFSAAFG